MRLKLKGYEGTTWTCRQGFGQVAFQIMGHESEGLQLQARKVVFLESM